MRKLVSLLLAVMLVLSGMAAFAQEGGYELALVTDVGNIDDQSFNQGAWEGVVELGNNSVNICLVAQCAEKDRIQLARDLNREVKLVFDRHNINIPFPQIVLNQPPQFGNATRKEKKEADSFVKEQKTASQAVEPEQQA